MTKPTRDELAAAAGELLADVRDAYNQDGSPCTQDMVVARSIVDRIQRTRFASQPASDELKEIDQVLIDAGCLGWEGQPVTTLVRVKQCIQSRDASWKAHESAVETNHHLLRRATEAERSTEHTSPAHVKHLERRLQEQIDDKHRILREYEERYAKLKSSSAEPVNTKLLEACEKLGSYRHVIDVEDGNYVSCIVCGEKVSDPHKPNCFLGIAITAARAQAEEDAKPVDEEWLKSVGFRDSTYPNGFGYMWLRTTGELELTVSKPRDRATWEQEEWICEGERVPHNLMPETRGDVRRLLTALGVNL